MLASVSVRTPWVIAAVALSLVSAGCGQPVREDRTIEFSRDGKQVAFQHGSEGVFVASKDGGAATKIFQPDENVLATSRPLTSPTDGRLLFATVKRLTEPTQPPQSTTLQVPADGRIVSEEPVRFTCWLRTESVGDQPAEVQELFQANCGHVGYVSAGLAVRWHPDGKRVTYVARVADDSQRHSVFEYDIESRRSWRIFPQEGDAVLCDWTPNGSALVCVVGNAASDRRSNSATEQIANHVTEGIWISQPREGGSWWHVPESERLPEGELPSLIEQLRASRPAWTRDGSSFAFVSREPNDAVITDDSAKRLIKHRLHRVELAQRALSKVLDVEGAITDLHWSGDGQRLGLMTRTAAAPTALKIVEPTGTISEVVTDLSIRKFAGFDSTSRRLAYITTSRMPPPSDPWWALLLRPDPQARDSVWIANADTKVAEPAIEIFSGTRVTFPLWSPTGERLSLWLTFSPRYRSLVSSLLRWGLLPGDPAATIDVRSGEISWLAVTPQEEMQIGHFHLLKGNNAEAWRWYEKARGQLPAPQPPQNWIEFTQRFSLPENSQVFESLCLKRLGREEEARAKWEEFEQNFFPRLNAAEPQTSDSNTGAAFWETVGPQAEFLKYLIRDLYVAEVFLSVDALDEALTHFKAESLSDIGEAEKLSRAIVLAQLYLIANDRVSYLTHCTNNVMPQAIPLWDRLATQQAGQPNDVLRAAVGLCLAPSFCSDFFQGLPDAERQANVQQWTAQRAEHSDGVPAIAFDLMLRATALHQSDLMTAEAAEARLKANPTGRELFANEPIDKAIARWFDTSQLNTGL